jgi:hypothetical protein
MSNFLVAYSTLQALKKNVSDSGYGIEEKYVREFHKQLEQIEKIVGTDTFNSNDFKIDDGEVKHFVALANYATGETTTSDERYCDTDLFKTKIDAALSYIVMISSDKEKTQIMGFHDTEG